MLMKNLMWWNLEILTAKSTKTLEKLFLLISCCSCATQPRPFCCALHVRCWWLQLKLNASQKKKKNHYKGRFPWHYLSSVEIPRWESSLLVMKLPAAFWSGVSCRACDKLSSEHGSLHRVPWVARYGTTSLIVESGLSSCHVQILL